MRVGYARVSRKEQAEMGNAFSNQQERLKEAGIGLLLIDVGSRTDDSRKNYLELQRLIRQGKVTEIICTRIDRLSGNLMSLLELAELCDRYNCKISPLDESVDTSSAIGLLQYSMTGAISSYNVRLIRQKVRQGYASLRKRHAANPRTPYGYLRVDEKYVIGESVRHICLDLIDTYINIKNLQKTSNSIKAKHGKFFNPSCLKDWFLNPVLRGHTPYGIGKKGRRIVNEENEIIIYNTHPDQRLLDDATHREITEIILFNRKHWGRNSGKNSWINPFLGLLYCGNCGTTIDLIKKSTRKKSAEVVRKTFCRGKTATFPDINCDHKGYCTREDIESVVAIELSKKANKIADTIEQPETISESPEILNLRSQINQLESIPNPNPAILTTIEDMKQQLKELRQKSDYGVGNQQALKEELVRVFKDPVLWDTVLKEKLTAYELQSVYHKFVKKIVIRDGKVSTIELTI